MTSAFRIAGEGTTLVGERGGGKSRTGTPPLVLLHGFGGSRHDWDPLISALPARIPLISYDQRGFGDSPADPDTPYSHSDDLLAVLDALELESVDLCGLSLGGGTGLNFALDHPERVRHLVLISPLMVGWTWTSEWIARWKEIGTAARSGDMALARELWWEHPLFDSTRESIAAPALREAIRTYHGQQWIIDNQRQALPDIDRLSQLSVPTLLLTGERDTEDFRLIGKVIEAMVPTAVRKDYPDAGHLLNCEIPAQIARDIARFLRNGR